MATGGMLPFEVQMVATETADPSFHADSILHVEFDFYGKRMVTVSSDKTVCIWDRDIAANTWKKTASWKVYSLILCSNWFH
jgi:WD40 repeat protein